MALRVFKFLRFYVYRTENEFVHHSINEIASNQRNSFKALNLTIRALEELSSKTNNAFHDLNKLTRIYDTITGQIEINTKLFPFLKKDIKKRFQVVGCTVKRKEK